MQIITNQFQKELKKHGSDEFPFLVSYESLSGYESGSFFWHWHPEIELTLVERGQMVYKVNQCSFHLKEGDVLFGNANALHAGFMHENQDCYYISITFDSKLIYGFRQSRICQKYVEPITRDFSLAGIHFEEQSEEGYRAGQILRKIIRLDEEKPDAYELDIVEELQAFWKLLLKSSRSGTDYTAHDRTEYERIREIMNYIEQNYQNKISLADISRHIHLCESECSRLFKRYMNMSLFGFLQEYRIERSLEALGNPECSITEAAASAGFLDPNYYSKVFAKCKGVSPRQYRKEIKYAKYY